MITQHEQTVAALAEAAGLDTEIGRDRVAEMVVEERIVLLKPSNEAESGMTAFSIVATAEDGGSFPKETLDEAISMNLFGSQTDKGHAGLFGDSLFFSMDINIDGVTPEQLTEQLLAFSRLAAEAPSSGLGSLGDFMQV